MYIVRNHSNREWLQKKLNTKYTHLKKESI